MLRGVLFDVDGTLVASNEAHARSWMDTVAEAGYDVPYDVVWPMIGMGGDKVLPSIIGIESESRKGQQLSKRRWEIFTSKYLPGLEPTPGARDLVSAMKEDGLQLVIATSAGTDELGVLLEAAGVADLFDVTTSADDAEDSKPDPDIVRAAVRKSGFPPEALVMIGDTPYDVQAALGARVKPFAVLCGGWTKEELSGAAAIYDHPRDLHRWYDRKWFIESAADE